MDAYSRFIIKDSLSLPLWSGQRAFSNLEALTTVAPPKIRIEGKDGAKDSAAEAAEVSISSLGKLLAKKTQAKPDAGQTAPDAPSGISVALKDLEKIGDSLQLAFDSVKEYSPESSQYKAGQEELKKLSAELQRIAASPEFSKAQQALDKMVKELSSGSGLSDGTKQQLKELGSFLGASFDRLVKSNDVGAIQAYSQSLDYIAQFKPENQDLLSDDIEEFNLSVETIQRLDGGDTYERVDQGRVVDVLKEIRRLLEKGLSAVDHRDAERGKQGAADDGVVHAWENEIDSLGSQIKDAFGDKEIQDFYTLLKQLDRNIKSGLLTFERAEKISEKYVDRFGQGLIDLLKSKSLVKVESVLNTLSGLFGFGSDGTELNRHTLAATRRDVKALIDTLKVDPFKNALDDKKAADSGPAKTKPQIIEQALVNLVDKLWEASKSESEKEKDKDKSESTNPHSVTLLHALQLISDAQ